MAGVVLARGGDLVTAPVMDEGDGEVPEGRLDLGVAGVGGRAVFPEDGIPQPVHTFDRPARLPQTQQIGRAGLIGKQGGDGIPLLLAQHLASAFADGTAVS